MFLFNTDWIRKDRVKVGLVGWIRSPLNNYIQEYIVNNLAKNIIMKNEIIEEWKWFEKNVLKKRSYENEQTYHPNGVISIYYWY